jgi:alkaline phosphatase D
MSMGAGRSGTAHIVARSAHPRRAGRGFGHARTAPLPWDRHATQVKFGFLSCRDWSANHWQTIEHLAAEDIDFVVHLGD